MDDLTSDELAPKLIEAALPHIPFDGWSISAIDRAADELGIPKMRAHLVFPGGGADMLARHLEMEAAWLESALAEKALDKERIRDRIRIAIWTKFEREEATREATRRAVSLMTLPPHAPLAARHLWRQADIMWRAAGDTATDFNHYSKRAILSGILSASMLYWLNDESEGRADTQAFIDRRIENVMQFEKVKAKVRKLDQYRPSLARFLGRLRYPGA